MNLDAGTKLRPTRDLSRQTHGLQKPAKANPAGPLAKAREAEKLSECLGRSLGRLLARRRAERPVAELPHTPNMAPPGHRRRHSGCLRGPAPETRTSAIKRASEKIGSSAHLSEPTCDTEP